MTVTFKVGKEDVLAMTMHYYNSSLTVRKSRMFTQASIPSALVLVAVALGYRYLVIVTPLLLIGVVWFANEIVGAGLHRFQIFRFSVQCG